MSKLKILIFSASLISIIIVGFFSYKYFSKSIIEVEHPFDAIPDNYAFIIEFESASHLQSVIKSDTGFLPFFVINQNTDSLFNELWTIENNISSIPELHDIWKTSKLYISSHFMGLDKFEYLFTFKVNGKYDLEDLSDYLSSSKVDFDLIKKEGNKYLSINLGQPNQRLFLAVNKGIISISFSEELFNKVFNQLKKGKLVSENNLIIRTLKMAGQGDAILYVNHDYFYRFLSQFAPNYRDELKLLRNFAGMTEFDIRFYENLILLSGYSLYNDSLNSYAQILASNSSVEVSQFDILPATTIYLFFQGSTDFQKYYYQSRDFTANAEESRLPELESKYGFTVKDNILPWIKNEVSFCVTAGLDSNSQNAYAIISTTDVKEAWQQLGAITSGNHTDINPVIDTTGYRNFPISLIPIENFIPQIFGSQFNRISSSYFTQIGNHIVFGNSRSAIQIFIDSYLIGQNLSTKSDFVNLKKYRSNKLNLYFYMDLNHYENFYKDFLLDEIDSMMYSKKLNLKGLSCLSLEISSENNGAFTSMVIGSKSGKTSDDLVPLGWQIALDSRVTGEPFLFSNPITKSDEILIFDEQNFLYRINQEGNVIWKIPILEKPLSGISKIDFFKNGTFQFVFNSENYIFVIDIDGNKVENYPFKLPQSANGGMTILDYDGLKDYRFLVPLNDGKLYNFSANQKPTSGWLNPAFTQINKTPVEYYRLNGKDFLLFSDTIGNVVFANRKGETRLQAKLAFTNNHRSKFYVLGSRIVTTDKAGRIIQIDNDGNVEKYSLRDFSSNHIFIMTDFDLDGKNDFVFYDNFQLSIYNQDREILFDTLMPNTSISQITEVKGKNKIRLVMKNQMTNSILFLTSDGQIISKTELGKTDGFLVQHATNSDILRLITFNNRVVSNFLIK
jgi:hypothetical protein